jgi:hypothetical protein
VLKKFLKWAQNEFDAKVKKIRSDNDTKFKNTQVEDYLDEEGNTDSVLAPYASQQNRVAKRKNPSMSFWPPILLNKMEWPKVRTELS